MLIAGALTPHPPIIVPAVGRGEEGTAALTISGMRELANRIVSLKPETLVVITPHGEVDSHVPGIVDTQWLQGDLGAFRAPQVSFTRKVDSDLVRMIIDRVEKADMEITQSGGRTRDDGMTVGILDHGVMVPLHFLQEAGLDPSCQVVLLTPAWISMNRLADFGRCLRKSFEEVERRIVFIASGDLSHRLKADGPYGFAPEGPRFDETLLSALNNWQPDQLIHLPQQFAQAAGECGWRPVVVLTAVVGSAPQNVEVLSYEGPFGVGYGVVWLEPGIS